MVRINLFTIIIPGVRAKCGGSTATGSTTRPKRQLRDNLDIPGPNITEICITIGYQRYLEFCLRRGVVPESNRFRWVFGHLLGRNFLLQTANITTHSQYVFLYEIVIVETAYSCACAELGRSCRDGY